MSHTRQGYDLLRALASASCDITHETGGTICYGHWVLRLVISYTRQRLELVPKCQDAKKYDLLRERGGTICFGHWVLCLVISHTRQGVRFVAGIGFCVLSYHTRDKAYELLPALRSASYDIGHETRVTIGYGHWVLRLVISHTRQGVRFVTGIGFCVL